MAQKIHTSPRFLLIRLFGLLLLLCLLFATGIGLLRSRNVAHAAPAICLNGKIVGIAATPDGGGYWLVGSDGGVFSLGDAGFYGSMGGQHLNAPVVGMAATPDGHGYWLVAADGGIFTFGDAGFYGSMGGQHLNAPMVGMARTRDGHGYWLDGADGGIFTFGDAHFYGSMGGHHLNAPVVGMAATPDSGGYWLVAADGGIFNFGDAGFYGSMGGQHLNAPVVGMAATPDGHGYWLVAADGGIFNFGDAHFYGSMGGQHLNQPVSGMAATSTGAGYWLTAGDGGVFTFGNAGFYGSLAGGCSPPPPGPTLWGVDSTSFITPSLLSQIEGTFGTPQFIGRYLDAIKFSPMTASEAAYIHSQGIRILPIQSDFQADTGYSNGVSRANDAIAKAQALGIPARTVIVADIESGSAVDAGFIEGWYATIAGAGYTVGYYENPYPGSSQFNGAFCAAVVSNPGIGGSILYSTEPSPGRTSRASAPAFAPAGLQCNGQTPTGQTLIWQYGLQGGGSVNVDTDEIQSSVPIW